MTHLPGYEELYIDPWYLNGGTSGASPCAVYINDEWPVTKEVFLNIFGWTLYNNGLVMNYPIMFN